MNNGSIESTNELSADVLQIVDRIRTTPVPQDSVERSLVCAELLDAAQERTAASSLTAPASRTGLRRWGLWLGLPIGVSVAVLVLMAIFLPASPTLAQALAATKSQPWLYGKVTYVVGENEYKSEFWFSAAKRVSAARWNETCMFVRFGESVEDNQVERYDPASGEITTQENAELRQQDLQLFGALLSEGSRSAFDESKPIEALQPGYDRYRVKLKGDDSGAEHVISVDRKSGLLDSWHVKQPDGMTAVTRFEYPRTGPESIDALRAMQVSSVRTNATEADPSQQLDVKPGQGVGAIRFGSSIADVRAALGEPDKEKPMGASAREMVYAELGLVLLVHNEHGVGSIQCCSNHTRYSGIYGVTMKGFPGKTKEGIGIGSTREELIAAYGEPTSNNKDGSIGYASQHIGYEFTGGRISRFGMRARSSACATNETEKSK